jgi:hypothetical protein
MARGLRLVAERQIQSREDHMPKLPEPDQFTITLNEGDMSELLRLSALEGTRLLQLKRDGVLNRKGTARCEAICELTTFLREAMPNSSGAGK